MRKNKEINCKIMTWPQYKAGYEELAARVAKLDKKLNKQTSQIFEILDRLAKIKNKNKSDIRA